MNDNWPTYKHSSFAIRNVSKKNKKILHYVVCSVQSGAISTVLKGNSYSIFSRFGEWRWRWRS